MTVYVDWLMNHGWRLGPNCHMTTDQEDLTELHEMARRIGMKRTWFQPAPPASVPHYDLVASRRTRAIKLGAVEIATPEQFLVHMKLLRELVKRGDMNGKARFGDNPTCDRATKEA
jgi:hypothetical protein